MKSDKTPKARKSLSIRQLFAFADTFDRIFVVLGAIIATITGFSWNLLTVAFGDVVDVFVAFERNARNNASEVETAEFLRDVYFFSYSLLALWILNFVANFLICLLFSRAANNQIRRIKNRYFESLLRQEVAWHDQNANTAFASTVTTDLKRIEDGMNEKFGLAVYNASTALIAIATAFIYGWKLTLIIISLLPFLAFGTSVMNKVQATFARKEVEAYAAAGAVAEEAIGGIRTVVAFGAQQHESERYERHLLPAMRSGIRRNLMTGLGNGLMFACLYAGLALGIWFGVQMILESRDYTIGTIVIVFWCVSGAGFSIGGAAPHFEAIAVARATAAKVFATIERRPLIDVTSEGGVKPEPIRAEIEFKNVDFWYPSRPEVKVLNGFSLTIAEGESVALVGASGSGKSTVLQLLQRFYDANGGVVSVGGRDVREWNVQYLRQQMGAVGQEPALFDTTIRENVALGSHSKLVDDKDVERAMQEANAAEFVAKLPQQWDTRVGDRGAQLSGGQKQRIAIARALINAPKVLLLDEATSALDTRSEAVVQTALEKASKGRTSVVVAHRLSTVVNCDRIVVMETGRVVETGTHAQLLERKGVYHALVRQQSAAAEPEVTDADESEEVESGDQVADEAEVLVGVDLEEEVLKKFSQKRLFALFAADKFYIFAGLALSLLYGLIVPIYAFIFGAFVEVFAQSETSAEIWARSHVFAYYYVAIAVAVGAISVSQMTILGVAGERLTLRLRKLAFDAILRQEITWFDRPDNSCGALCARLSADAANVQGASGSRMAIICQALSTFLASAVLGFVLSWQLSLVAMVFIPFILIGSAIGASVDNWTARANKRGVEMAAKVAIETLSSIRTVISLQREQHFSQQFQRIVDENAKTTDRKCVARALLLAFSLSIVFLSYSIVFLFGGILLSRGLLTSGHFFVIIETLIYGSMTVGQSSVFTSDYRKAKISAANIFRLLDRRSREAEVTGSEIRDFQGNVAFAAVHFHYPGRPEARVLRGLSLEVKSGQKVALVGASGCGKSTSVQLLERFYDVTRGAIHVDGRDVTSVDRHWLRRQMALVSQEPTLFSGTIRENIAYGARDVTFDAIVRSAQMANVHDFVQSLPSQYETRVGARGAQLSGGQKQRIAIARALIRDPRILLLDEATSALDTASEECVQMALEEAAKGRTCLVIAHRMSTVRSADVICVLERGAVVESGSHEQLMQRKGVYFRLNSL